MGFARLYPANANEGVLRTRPTPEHSWSRSSDDGSTLAGVWHLNEDDQGYRDDLAFTYRRAWGADR